ncbi:MAG: hypothetical protein JWR69_2660 [Pedosphaera sp.]|nr:hypothetical protein [Pedosphaera sp.]
MTHARTKRATNKRGKTRFPGIGKDAAALGVRESTLRRVLKGEWKSDSLTRRYLALKTTPKPITRPRKSKRS